METEIPWIYSATVSTGFYNSSQIAINPAVGNDNLKWTTAEIVKWIQIIIRPILVIFGTVGHGLTVYIMRTTSLKKISCCFYVFLLALADTRKYLFQT